MIKTVVVFIACFILVGCSGLDPLTDRDLILQGAATALIVYDWAQMKEIEHRPDGRFETNPLFSRYPNQSEFDTKIPLGIAALWLITYIIPEEIRGFFQVNFLIFQSIVVSRNYESGIRIRGGF